MEKGKIQGLKGPGSSSGLDSFDDVGLGGRRGFRWVGYVWDPHDLVFATES